MKLNQRQLQRIIREAVNRKLANLNEAWEEGGLNETLDAIAGGISHQIIEHLEDEATFSNVGEMTMGSLTGDPMLPGRYEDVEHFASKIANQVARETHEVVEKTAKEMLESLMSQFNV